MTGSALKAVPRKDPVPFRREMSRGCSAATEGGSWPPVGRTAPKLSKGLSSSKIFKPETYRGRGLRMKSLSM
jgi:hypothetical protein